jgi:hypothetical protein
MSSKDKGGRRFFIILNVAVVIAFGLPTFNPVARADQPIDITYCLSLVSTVVSENEEMTVTSFDFKGIARSNLPDKAFDNLTFHGVGVGRVVAGKSHNYGYIKFMNPDGDYVVTENLRELGDTDATWKFLQGTGKWKGIQGGGKLQPAARGRPILKDTVQGCIRMTGTYELPKK